MIDGPVVASVVFTRVLWAVGGSILVSSGVASDNHALAAASFGAALLIAALLQAMERIEQAILNKRSHTAPMGEGE